LNNELGYINSKPFSKLSSNNNRIIITEKEKNLEIKVEGADKYSCFDNLVDNFGNIMSSSTFYGIDSKYCPITFFGSFITNTSYSSISSLIIKCSSYVIGRESFNEITHFTTETKIKKINYYNDDLIYFFSNNPMRIKRSKDGEINIYAKREEPVKLFDIKYKNNLIDMYLIQSFNSNGNIYDYSIKPIAYLQFVFKNEIVLEDIEKLISCIDSTLHMCILNQRKSYVCTLYTDDSLSYNLYKCKYRNTEVDNKIRYNMIHGDNTIEDFKKIFKIFLNIDFKDNNSFSPFINYNIKLGFHELDFLQYYKVLEVIDFNKQKIKNEDKDKRFLLKYFKKYEQLMNSLFKDYNIKKLEAEIRSLRKYYSHEGFYVELLPVPTDKPRRFLTLDYSWLKKVILLIKTISYLEVYSMADININELEVLQHLM